MCNMSRCQSVYLSASTYCNSSNASTCVFRFPAMAIPPDFINRGLVFLKDLGCSMSILYFSNAVSRANPWNDFTCGTHHSAAVVCRVNDLNQN